MLRLQWRFLRLFNVGLAHFWIEICCKNYRFGVVVMLTSGYLYPAIIIIFRVVESSCFSFCGWIFVERQTEDGCSLTYPFQWQHVGACCKGLILSNPRKFPWIPIVVSSFWYRFAWSITLKTAESSMSTITKNDWLSKSFNVMINLEKLCFLELQANCKKSLNRFLSKYLSRRFAKSLT